MRTVSGDALLRVLSGEDPPSPRWRLVIVALIVAAIVAWSAWWSCALRSAASGTPAARAADTPGQKQR